MNSDIKYEITALDVDIEAAMPGDLPDTCADSVARNFNAALERILKEIGPERVSYILHPPPPNWSMARQVIGHHGEWLGEVWIEWPKPGPGPYVINIRSLVRERGT